MGFLLSPSGRVSRRGLWLGYVLTFAVLGVAAYFGDRALAARGAVVLPDQLIALQPALDIVGGPLVLAVLVLVPWASAMMVLKRLHDRGFGGMLLVWKLVVLGGLAWLMLNAENLLPGDAGRLIAIMALVLGALMVLRTAVIVLFLAGQDGDNRFGPDPLVR
ncbi:MAG: hypothetical protein FD124_3439 [Alphaproteobacteria bacterium]|nr:MAG: hypothetical protein FD160_1790 [Caulobacteraceae bacterium]TPW02336.1 MAG: hypothetical protein FD124_3439 [Alphaproteobacteria bacterium]